VATAMLGIDSRQSTQPFLIFNAVSLRAALQRHGEGERAAQQEGPGCRRITALQFVWAIGGHRGGSHHLRLPLRVRDIGDEGGPAA